MSLPSCPPGLPKETEESFQRLLAFPLDTQERMLEALDRYLQSMQSVSVRYPNMDLILAKTITQQLKRMLAYDPANTPELHQRWVQAAARYFFLGDDASHDWETADGFQDDAEVVGVVAEAIGHGQLEGETGRFQY